MSLGGGGALGVQYCMDEGGGGGRGESCWVHGLTHGHSPHFIEGSAGICGTYVSSSGFTELEVSSFTELEVLGICGFFFGL